MWVKKCLAFFTAIVVTLNLCGCMAHTELDKEAIIEAIGIDYEKGEYKVTAQYFNTDSEGGSTMVNNTEPNVIVISGKGKTVSDALEDASYRSGKAFMLGITGVCVIGKEAAKQDIKPLLSFATSNYQSNPKMYVTVAEDKAEEVINVKFKEGSASVDKLENILKNADKLGLCKPMMLFDVMKKLSQPTKSLVLPLFKVIDDEGGFTEDDKNVCIDGGALIHDGEYEAALSVKEMSGARLLSGKAITAQLTVTDNNRDVTVALYNVNKDIEPIYSKGRLSFKIMLTADGKYINSNLSDPEEKSDRVARLCEKAVAERVKLATEKVLKGRGADAFGFKHAITSKEYFSWLKIEENYGELLKNGTYDVECKVTVRRFSAAHDKED